MQAVSIKKYLIRICLVLNTPNVLSVAKSCFCLNCKLKYFNNYFDFDFPLFQQYLHCLVIFLGIKITFYILLIKTNIRVSSDFYNKE